MRVTTESGAIYEFEGDSIRRVHKIAHLRKDGEWIRLLEPVTPVVGQSMTLKLEPLDERAFYTERRTTIVTGVAM